MSKNILITGGAGFVGSTLSIGLKLRYPNYRIIALDNLRRRGSELNLSRLREAGVEFVHGDIRNQEDLTEFTQLDFILDASADPSVLSGINSPVMPLINANLGGTVNCLELAQKTGAAFIFLSTSRIYPIRNLEIAAFEELDTRFIWKDEQTMRGISSKGVTEDFPLEGSRSFYGTTKLASELLITEYNELKGLKSTINRCGVISGPWQMGKVDQGVLVLWLARHYNNQTINVGGGLENSFSLQELTILCEEITGNKIRIKPVMENRTADVRIYVSDCSKLNQINGGAWKPKKSMKDLVADTFAWMQANENNLKNILN
jgi:CDP-paratose 2-epimerase